MLGITFFPGTGHSEPQALVICRVSILRFLQSPIPKSLFLLLQMRSPCCLTMKQSSRQSFWGLCRGHSFHIPLEKASAPPNHHHKSPQVISQVISTFFLQFETTGYHPKCHGTSNLTCPWEASAQHPLPLSDNGILMLLFSLCGHVGLLGVGSQLGPFVCSSL